MSMGQRRRRRSRRQAARQVDEASTEQPDGAAGGSRIGNGVVSTREKAGEGLRARGEAPKMVSVM